MVNGKIGICEDSNNCPIPPRYCGDPVSTRIVDFKKKVGYVDDITIIQMPWMVTIGKYGKEDIWDHWILATIPHSNRKDFANSVE